MEHFLQAQRRVCKLENLCWSGGRFVYYRNPVVAKLVSVWAVLVWRLRMLYFGAGLACTGANAEGCDFNRNGDIDFECITIWQWCSFLG